MNTLRPLALAALGFVASGVSAQEVVGRVISSAPVIQQVAVPRQVCSPGATVQPQTSGAGGVIGALVGAAIGSQFGGGSGRGAAMVAGTMAGAVIGNSVEAQNQRQAQGPQCVTETFYENRTVAWQVTYEYGGREFSTRLPYDPGPTIRLQVTPVGAAGDTPPPQVFAPQPMDPVQVTTVPPPVAAPATTIVYTTAYASPYPVYQPVYTPVVRPYYPPVGVSLQFDYSRRDGWRGRPHRH